MATIRNEVWQGGVLLEVDTIEIDDRQANKTTIQAQAFTALAQLQAIIDRTNLPAGTLTAALQRCEAGAGRREADSASVTPTDPARSRTARRHRLTRIALPERPADHLRVDGGASSRSRGTSAGQGSAQARVYC